ncbi:MAG TPA: hypothetical protein VEZ90_00630 [Blastocatellia bacterium]|nr:hypothetical protein [Blastocatellia bacterium]
MDDAQHLGRSAALSLHPPACRDGDTAAFCPQNGATDSVGQSERVLTIGEVARELRCSKAHVCNVINGKVKNVFRLPAISMGRRKLVRRGTLEWWKQANEKGDSSAMLPTSPEVNAVGRMKGEFHA